MKSISDYLTTHGPSRSSDVSEWLMSGERLSADAARKRLSGNRLKEPVRAFPIQLLPKKEAFLYLQHQRQEESFWVKYLSAMRASKSVFGLAIDGLIARKGLVPVDEFSVISGASASGLTGQIMAKSVAERLIVAGAIVQRTYDGVEYFETRREVLCYPDHGGASARALTEKILLDGVREWVRKMGLASYNRVAIRGEAERQPIRSYMFDLAGPSYLQPLKQTKKQPGYFVADVFAQTVIDEHQIQYFLRKTTTVHGLLRSKGAGLLGALIAEGFTSAALTLGHSAGVILTTPQELFGKRASASIRTLLQTLSDTAAYASAEGPERIVKLIDDLAEIEGASGNLRGILFELLSAYLVRRSAVSIDMGVRASDPNTGKSADIDILSFSNQGSHCKAIECKGRKPGGTVSLEEVQDWIRRLPIFTAHLRAQPHLRESQLSFEIWTSGTFEADAVSFLENEKTRRLKQPIDWKNGENVLRIALDGKEKAISNALREHFLRHPLAVVIHQSLEDSEAQTIP